MTRAQINKRLEAMQSFTSSAHGELSTLCDDLNEYWEEKSEKWQESEKGTAFKLNIESLEEHLDTLDELSMIEWPE